MKKVKGKLHYMQYLSKQRQALLAMAIMLVSTLISAAQNSGTLDAGFGTGGKVTTDFGREDRRGRGRPILCQLRLRPCAI
jgi:hypothetical protein